MTEKCIKCGKLLTYFMMWIPDFGGYCCMDCWKTYAKGKAKEMPW